MYFPVSYGSPPTQDPQKAQKQKIMAIVSPAMIAFFGFKYRWASALYIYWLALNVFTVAQQYVMFRRYGLIGGKKTVAAAAVATPALAGDVPNQLNGAAAGTAAAANGRRRYRTKKRSRR